MSYCALNLDQARPASALAKARRFTAANGLFGLGQAYLEGSYDCDNLEEVLFALIKSPDLLPGRLNLTVLGQLLAQLCFNEQRGRRAFEVAERHYDLGNDLFAAMLDSSMSYTCGYWRDAQTLEQAQDAKLDLICRKLKLAPGMRVLDIGCGWGNFAAYAAKHYAVEVTGLTVSREQAEFARRRCSGLAVQILLRDYSDFSGQFDRVVSIEMIEAVGLRNVGRFFKVVENCLRAHGLFLLQVISAESFSTRSLPALDQFLIWLRNHIFPNGYLPKLSELTAPGRRNLVVEDLENFSADYERTLQAWRANFQHAWPTLQQHYGEKFRRMWLYYLCGCMVFFRSRIVQLYQIVYAHEGLPGGYASVR